MSARVALVQPQAGLLKFGGGGGASSSIFGMQSATVGMQRLVAARYFQTRAFPHARLLVDAVSSPPGGCEMVVRRRRSDAKAVMRCKTAVLWNPLALNSLSADAFLDEFCGTCREA